MKRRAVLTMLAGAALLPRAVVALDRRAPGRPHKDPATLVEEDVDALMWPIVQRINRSGWVWTTECCQGHDEPQRGPMLGIVSSGDRAIALLSQAAREVASQARYHHEDPAEPPFLLGYFSRPVESVAKYGDTQVRINHIYHRRLVGRLDLFERFSWLV